MRKKLKIVMSICLSVIIPLSCSRFSIEGAEAPSDSNSTYSTQARQLFQNANFVEYSHSFTQQYEVGSGITVIYGRNLDISRISAGANYDDVMKCSDVASVKDNSVSDQLSDDQRETYMAIYMNGNDKIDVQYVSLSYDSSVSEEVIDNFINTDLSEASLYARTQEFIGNQLDNLSSAYNVGMTASARASSTTRVVLNVVDTNYYIDTYVTTSGGTYPLLIYRKDVTYQATIVANELDDDLYIIVAYVHVIPGTNITSFTSAELNAVDGAYLYNRTYGNAIAVKGIRTIFENMYPDMDRYISMSPSSNLTDVNNKTISVSLGIPLSFSVSFDIISDSLSRIDMDTTFDAYGQCVVKFEAFSTSFSPCISTEQFSYTAGVYMSSGAGILSTSVATDVLYYFQPSGSSSAIWAGSARNLYYENNS